ncbi:hypothetical protein Sango_3012900 [Sesamum angolense]|uniref:Endonuclease/exonuclease/phosphatase domain-containing protein n=1 Tax=Sesamum angolense TaxID=2727404 RepID=A0AAE1T3N8_9LAMI|nr:hypothetical protein Sango_3012900 [Sesamum angolense]
MRIGFWNVRGFNRPLKHNGVAHLIKNNQLCLLGILETKLTTSAIARIINRTFPGWCQTNNFDVIVGGRILIIWNPAVIDLVPEDISPQMIHCRVKNKSSQLSFYISFIYGLYTVVHRRSMWDKLLELGQPMNMPWLILGDFNCVKSATEKQLGATPTWYELKDFADCCLSRGLNDAPQRDVTYLVLQSDSIPVGVSLIGCFTTSGLRPACFVMRISAHRDAFPTTLRVRNSFPTSPHLRHRGPTLPVDNAVFNWAKAFFRACFGALQSCHSGGGKASNFYISDTKHQTGRIFSMLLQTSMAIVGDQVCTAVLDFLGSGHLRQLNHSIIALVPKSDCQTIGLSLL